MSNVRRVYVEKKEAYAVKAKELHGRNQAAILDIHYPSQECVF